jgi:hypothetical protein
MAKNLINKIASIGLPVVVIGCTTALFLMFRPDEPTALYYTNLGYLIFLEALFFSYINVLYLKKSEELSSPFYAIFGVYTLYYTAMGLGWLILYSLVLTHFAPLKIYVAGIIVLTLIWLVVSLVTAQADTNFKKTVDTQRDSRYSLDLYNQKMNRLFQRCRQLCEDNNAEQRVGDLVDKLRHRFGALSPTLFSNDLAVSRLNSVADKFADILDRAEDAGSEAAVDWGKKLSRFVDDVILELDIAQNMARK